MLSDLPEATQHVSGRAGTPKILLSPLSGEEEAILPTSPFSLGHHSSALKLPFKKQREKLKSKAVVVSSHLHITDRRWLHQTVLLCTYVELKRTGSHSMSWPV